MQYNPNPMASSPYNPNHQQMQQQFIRQEQNKSRPSGILFLDSRSSNCQHFYTIWEQTMNGNGSFVIVDVAKEPHKFTPTIRRNSGGQLPIVVVRGVKQMLVGNTAFQWLSHQQKMNHAQSMQQQQSGIGGSASGGSSGGPQGYSQDNPMVSGMPSGQNISDATNPNSMAQAQSSLDSMYGEIFTTEQKKMLTQQAENKSRNGGSSMSYSPLPVQQQQQQQQQHNPQFQQGSTMMGQNTRQSISNNELDDYMQRREAACPPMNNGPMPF